MTPETSCRAGTPRRSGRMAAMAWLRELLNAASRPPLVFCLLATILLAAFALRKRLSRPIPAIAAVAGFAAVFAFCISDGTFRSKALAADNAAVFLLLGMTAIVLFAAMREASLNDESSVVSPEWGKDRECEECAGSHSGTVDSPGSAAESGTASDVPAGEAGTDAEAKTKAVKGISAGSYSGIAFAPDGGTPGREIAAEALPASVPGTGIQLPAETVGGAGVSATEPHGIKVATWPHLLYIELITAVFVTAALIAWSLIADASLDAPADPSRSPNPARAPWYFAGIQEMLAYFDPWLGGAVIPSLIVFGLAAVPYLDPNPSCAGMYTFRRRPAAVAAFLFGFVVLWIGLIIVGTFVRGPNWDAYGIFEPWDGSKIECPAERPLSCAFWEGLLRRKPPAWPPARELPGILFLAAYFAVPSVLAARAMPDARRSMGAVRFWAAALLILAMFGIVTVIYLRWLFGIRHIVSFPEILFNI